jgi:YebC/PmpR family DNA-binding regulatory protein
MAGHSKWANIQHRKNAQDARRGKLFTKLIREITIAARVGGSDMTSNSRLRLAIDKAFAANMTRDTVDRAVKRGSGDLDGAALEEVRYEGYGPGGVAVMVECMTDNRNRTVAEVRHAFTKQGGNLGADGSVAYLFNRTGVLSYGPETDYDALMEAALEAAAEDIVRSDDGSLDLLVTPDDFEHALAVLQEAGFEPASAEITERAATNVRVEGEAAESVLKLLERLEDLDDVQNVYSNADFPEELLV